MRNLDEYSPFPADSRFLIKKFMRSPVPEWYLCLKTDIENPRCPYPINIAMISHGVGGTLSNATNLAWMIHEKFRGQGIMKKFLKEYIYEVTPSLNGFAVIIQSHNEPSLALAKSVGFEVYEQNEKYIMLKKLKLHLTEKPFSLLPLSI